MKKIMIVDDNYLSAEGIEKNIDWETLNAEIIHVCYNGTSAIEAMKKEPADLIISDIEMPDLDGISMSRQALEINPMVKIILISAYDKFEYARRALLLGALDYIEKPLDYAYLIQKVKNAFADRKSTRLKSSHITISYAVFCLKKRRVGFCAGRGEGEEVWRCGWRVSGGVVGCAGVADFL